MRCIICSHQAVETWAPECGHVTCKLCMNKWKSQGHNNCYLCKKIIKNPIRIFLPNDDDSTDIITESTTDSFNPCHDDNQSKQNDFRHKCKSNCNCGCNWNNISEHFNKAINKIKKWDKRWWILVVVILIIILMPPIFLGPLTHGLVLHRLTPLRCIAIKNFYPENFDPFNFLGISANDLMAPWGGNKLKIDTYQRECYLSYDCWADSYDVSYNKESQCVELSIKFTGYKVSNIFKGH